MRYNPKPTRYQPKPEKYNSKPVVEPCRHPDHYPGPLMVSLRKGQSYMHVCPGCGFMTTVTGTDQPEMK